MNLTIQIIGVQPEHLLPIDRETSRHNQGDVVGVYFSTPETPSPNSRLVSVHITGIPAVNEDKALELILPAQNVIDHEPDGSPVYEMVHRHKWAFNALIATTEEISDLTLLRELTTTWDRAKQVLINKSTGLFITDADIN